MGGALMATVTFIKYQKQSAGALHGVAGYVSQKQKTEQGQGHEQSGILLRREGRELEVPADEHHRPEHEVRFHQGGIHLPDGERGVSGALDEQ